jgi:lipopolysaccharide heptosyltransferase III
MLTQQRRILVYRTGQIGDTVVALPAFWAIRQSFPSAHLALLTGRHRVSEFLLASEVLPPSGLFDEVITYPTDVSGLSPNKMPRTLGDLRRGRFDTLVYLAPRTRTRWQVRRDLAFFRLAGIRHFIGHKGITMLPERTLAGKLPEVEHEADHLLDRLTASGLSVPSLKVGQLGLLLTETERARASAWINAEVGSIQAEKLLVAFGPGSKFTSKLWPEERFAEVGKSLAHNTGIYPIVFGGPEDFDLGERLLSGWNTGANAAGQLTVRESAACLSHCSLFIGNDNGPMHLAAAVGVPCVAVFSGIDWPGRWHPYGPGHIVLRRSVPCDGCQLRECLQNDLICLKRISVDDVLSAVEHQLNRITSTRDVIEASLQV